MQPQSGEHVLQLARTSFYPMNYADAAHSSLLRFKQGALTLGAYLLEFLRLQQEIPPGSITQSTLRVILMQGVNEPYHSDLLRLNTTSFCDLFDYLQRMANTFSLIHAPHAMEVDHLHTSFAPGPPMTELAARLLYKAETNAINAKVLLQFICVHCRKRGHMIRDCKIRRQERSREAEKRRKEKR